MFIVGLIRNGISLRKQAYASSRCLLFCVKQEKKKPEALDKDIAEMAINKAVFDPSNKVRITVLNVCSNGYVPKDISVHLVELLRNDANFSIRERASLME